MSFDLIYKFTHAIFHRFDQFLKILLNTKSNLLLLVFNCRNIFLNKRYLLSDVFLLSFQLLGKIYHVNFKRFCDINDSATFMLLVFSERA